MRKVAILALFVAVAGAAQYSVTLQPGDSVTVTAPAAAPAPTPVPTPTPTGKTPLGINLPGPDDWNMGARAKVFVDVMKTSRQIAPNQWLVLTTSNNQVPELNWGTAGSRQPKITGTYALSWSGDATVIASGATVKNSFYVNGQSAADVVVVSDSVDVILKFSKPATNIVLLRPGYPRVTTQTVTNEFKAFCAPFTTIRFMDAMVTNWADAAAADVRFASLGADKKLDWAERPSDSEQTYNRPWGLSIEAAVRVANETKCNPWIPIPWCATDDYVAGLADYEKANLDPTLTAYHEWGNELWNYGGGFYTSTLFKNEAVANATAAKLANPPDNEYYYAARYAAARTIAASSIFKAKGVNAKFILSSQFANPSFVADALNWALRTYPNPPNYYLAGIACAPYIGASSGTVDNMLAALTADVATRQANDSKLMNWRAIADAYQLKLYNYESGIDVGQGTGNLANRIALAYDARLSPVVKSYLENCYLDAGLSEMQWFNGICTRDKWGIWGLTDDAVDLTQPAYLAAKGFALTAAPTGGVTATFYQKSDFTVPLGTIVVPLINHRWQNWSTGGVWGRKDVTTTEARNGSIRFTGRYVGPGTLKAECEANDSAVLTIGAQGTFMLDYRAIFDGNGTAFVRLTDSSAVVRQSQLLPQ